MTIQTGKIIMKICLMQRCKITMKRRTITLKKNAINRHKISVKTHKLNKKRCRLNPKGNSELQYRTSGDLGPKQTKLKQILTGKLS